MRWETKEPNICIKKCETDWRLISININSFPTERNGIEKGKYDLLKQTIAESEADIVGISELGKNENNIPYYSRLSNVIKTWVENGAATAACNKRNNLSSYEPGGVLMMTKDKSTAHTIKRGIDDRNLGRWTWVTFKGKRKLKTTVVTVYRPTNLQVTALNQLGTIRKTRCIKQPEEVWEDDLTTLIMKRIDIGEVIVMGDFNDDLNNDNSKINTFFRNLRMREVLNEKYGPGPPTFFMGSNKIDGIFASDGISIRQGGYGGMQFSPSDHLYPWIDVEEMDIVGREKDDRPPPLLRKTTSKIPTVRKSFSSLLNEDMARHKLYEKAKRLMESAKANKSLTSSEASEYEKLRTVSEGQ